jgi:hypothetical protein
MVRIVSTACLAATLSALAACGPTPAEQRAEDQSRCGGFGFQPGTDAFAHCMMNTAAQRDAQQAADRRQAAAQQAASDRQNAAIKAQKDTADQDAWDRRTGQGAYSNSPSSTFPSSNPVDTVRNSIQNDMDRMDRAGTLSP